MARLILAALILFATPHAAVSRDAAPALPRLKELVTVTSEVVRIGDLVANAGAAADIPVFRAPDPGQTGTVAVARIAEALRPHRITALDTAGLSEVVVTRLSRAITPAEIKTRIVRALAGRYGFGAAQDLGITPDRPLRTVHVDASVTGELAIAKIAVDPRTGRFDVQFELLGTEPQPGLRVTGVAIETAEAPVLVRAVGRGDIIRQSDVAIERRPKAELGRAGVLADHPVGLAAKRTLRAGTVLRADDLMRPEVIRRNEAVTIVYQVPGIVLTMRGKALEAGAVGDLINVSNVQSKRTIQGTVTGPGRVMLTAAAPVVASTAAPELPPTQ